MISKVKYVFRKWHRKYFIPNIEINILHRRSIRTIYSTVRPSVRGDNPRALASGFILTVHADNRELTSVFHPHTRFMPGFPNNPGNRVMWDNLYVYITRHLNGWRSEIHVGTEAFIWPCMRLNCGDHRPRSHMNTRGIYMQTATFAIIYQT